MHTWKNASASDTKMFAAISISLKKHPHLINYLFEKHRPRLSDAAENILEASFALSSGENLLIQIALDMWSGSGGTNIYDMLTVLDDQNFVNVLSALLTLRQMPYQIIKINNIPNETECKG
jgi:hypothetical protein